jgi:hypothetical protein
MFKKGMFLSLLLVMSLSIGMLSAVGIRPVSAYKSDPPNPTHTFIFNQANQILRDDGWVSVSDFLNSIDPADPSGRTYLQVMIAGSSENDNIYPPLLVGDSSCWNHYMDSTDHHGIGYLGITMKSAGVLCQERFDAALDHWIFGDWHDAIYDLGWAAHLVQDICVPHHTYPTWQSEHDTYENWVKDNQYSFAVNSGGIYEFSPFPDSAYYTPTHYGGGPYINAFDWVDYSAHESIKYFGSVNYGNGMTTDDYFVETVHNLPNNVSTTWVVTYYQASQIQVHFAQIQMETNYDYVKIYDANDNLIASYTGTQSNVWTPIVVGNTLKIKTTTDTSVQSWGYKTDNVQFYDTGDDLEGTTSALLARAQRTTAGFIKSFFDQVGLPASLKIVNPLTGTQWFNFAAPDKSVGDTFIINITLAEVTDLTSWQFGLQWNSGLLTYVNATIPSDSVFAGQSILTSGPDNTNPAIVVYSAALAPGGIPFTGSGRLAQVELRIVHGVGQSPLSFEGIGIDTFLLDKDGVDIPSTKVNGHYEYSTVRLAIVNADTPPDIGTNFFNLTGKGIGDTFKINLTVVDVIDLASWQVRVSWDPAELEFVSFVFPSDHIFATMNPLFAGPDSSVPGTVIGGAAARAGTFTGTGTLAMLTLRLLVVPTGLDPTPIAGDIDYTAFGVDTFLLDGVGVDIPFTVVNGYYKYAFAIRDVAIINLTSTKTIIGQGYVGNVTLTAENQGDFTENFNVTIYANATQITVLNFVLANGTSQAKTFSWNTTGFAYGNYTVNAYAEPLLEEVDIVDNNCTCSLQVHVGVPGDISGPTQGVYDGTTNMRDINYMITLFNTYPFSSNWNPNADVNNDVTVNMRDIQIAILNFNKHE